MARDEDKPLTWQQTSGAIVGVLVFVAIIVILVIFASNFIGDHVGLWIAFGILINSFLSVGVGWTIIQVLNLVTPKSGGEFNLSKLD